MSGKRTHLACWRWRPRHRELCLSKLTRAFSASLPQNSWGDAPGSHETAPLALAKYAARRLQLAIRDKIKPVNLLTLIEIRRAAWRTGGIAVSERVHVQVECATSKLTSAEQPFSVLT